MRHRRRTQVIVAIQRTIRGFCARKRLKRQKLEALRIASAIKIQRWLRDTIATRAARIFVQELRIRKAVGNIQRVLRGFMVCHELNPHSIYPSTDNERLGAS